MQCCRLSTVNCRLLILSALASVAGSPPVAGAEGARLEIVPPRLELSGPRDIRRVLVARVEEGGERLDLTAEARLRPGPGSGVEVDADGYLVPARDGEHRVKVEARGLEAELVVAVKGAAEPAPVSYLREVQPILSRVGCTAGACHGGAKGRNGFKLSLRGYDPEWDYRALTEDLSGRRVNTVEAEKSLMLLKPSQGVPHQGGLVMEEGSRYWRLIRQWIAEGARSDFPPRSPRGDGDVASAGRVERLTVAPTEVKMADAGAVQQILVLAHYPDGSTRDVTRDSVFTCSATTVAEVSPEGRLNALRRGEAAVLVRYEGAYGLARVTILGPRPGYQWKEVPELNFIDTLVHRKLRRLQILPSEPCSDDEFLRRVSLDLTGVPPTPEEARAFLSEAARDAGRDDPAARQARRERLVERLFRKPEFVDHWALKWGDLLQANRKFLGEKGVWGFRSWIRQQVANNRPYDEFVREILTAVGSSMDHPAVSFLRAGREPSEVMESTSQLFLGVRMACAKCHDHPFEPWTQGNYYGLSAYFARVGRKPGPRREEEVVYEKADGEVLHPKDSHTVRPIFPFAVAASERGGGAHGGDAAGGQAAAGGRQAAPLAGRRQELADWLTTAENPYFARAIANRLWSYFFGRGIIDPVDDIRSSNPPSNPELLEALADDLVRHRFDTQRLMRLIVTSRVYGLSVETNSFNADDQENFSHAVPRRLNAEQLRDAISVATGTLPRFPGVPADFRAAQLPDGQIAAGGFLDLFGRPPRESVCECERRSDLSLSQALNLVNGPVIAEAVAGPDGRAASLAKSEADDGKVVEALYLAALSRFPSPGESLQGVKAVRAAETRQQGTEDLLWALLNSPGFLFNR